jgi:hypothetical protein
MQPAEVGSTRTRRARAVRPVPARRAQPSRCRTYRPELFGLEFEETQRVVQPNDLCVLLAFLGSQRTLSALLRELFRTRREVQADCAERCLKLFNSSLVHGFFALRCSQPIVQHAITARLHSSRHSSIENCSYSVVSATRPPVIEAAERLADVAPRRAQRGFREGTSGGRNHRLVSLPHQAHPTPSSLAGPLGQVGRGDGFRRRCCRSSDSDATSIPRSSAVLAR